MPNEQGKSQGKDYIKGLIYRICIEDQVFEPSMIIGNTAVDVRALLLGRHAANVLGIDISIKSPLQAFIIGVAFDEHGEVLAAVHLTEDMLQTIPKNIDNERWQLRTDIAKTYFLDKQISQPIKT